MYICYMLYNIYMLYNFLELFRENFKTCSVSLKKSLTCQCHMY